MKYCISCNYSKINHYFHRMGISKGNYNYTGNNKCDKTQDGMTTTYCIHFIRRENNCVETRSFYRGNDIFIYCIIHYV